MNGDRRLPRRALLATGLVIPCAALWWLRSPDPTQSAVPLDWHALLPHPEEATAIRGVIEHEQIAGLFVQPPSTGVRTEWNGQIVRMPGYTVPIAFDGDLVTEFILVPYVGACIHVPPPPANQLVYVTTETPFQSAGVFDPVTVTGVFHTTPTSTRLAEIGYMMSASSVDAVNA